MKRIYRVEKDAKIAGICGGIGEVLSFDPTLVRLAAVFLCAATAFFPLIITYLIGWFIIPLKSEVEKEQHKPV